MIIAKPVIPDQFWILKENDQKVGNIEAGPDGYSLCLKDRKVNFQTLNMLKERINIDFEPITTDVQKPPKNEVHGFPTDDFPHNAIFDVKRQIPLWTKEEKSKSWYAAGWYKVKVHRTWDVVQCPKLISLQRYPYKGPFHTESQAKEAR